MPEVQDGSGTATQVGVALASLAEAWLRDTLFAGVGLLSLVVAVCGFATADGAAYAVLGLVAALLAVALPTVAFARRARVSRLWLAILGGALLDAVALAVILTG